MQLNVFLESWKIDIKNLSEGLEVLSQKMEINRIYYGICVLFFLINLLRIFNNFIFLNIQNLKA